MSRVYVGLSGGVDSATSAALLKEQGHQVTGCFIKIWQPEFIECTWREDRLDAMRVAAALGIPFREIDLSDAYKREVVDPMIVDYARGITPNPDVLCNRSIKFGHFLKWALGEGADMIATGHYARIVKEDTRYYGLTKSVKFTDFVSPLHLLRGKDLNKDQSYFLWQLGTEELSRALFPIGTLTKRDVRALAKKFKLPNAKRPDSQGLCFVGDVSMDDFLARFLPIAPGTVLDMKGHAVGEHRGAALYTIGQRHGFSVRGSKEKSAHYVVSVDTSTNTITVSESRLNAARTEIMLEHVRWIHEAPSRSFECEAQARYREKPVRVRIEKSSEETHVVFFEPHLVAPGQSLVLYQDDYCLGGGTISRWQARS